jgi:predicted DNA-binding transcriptional regulator AlpA
MKTETNETPTIDTDVLTPRECAAMLRVTMAWIYDHVRRANPVVPHFRLGGQRGQIRFKRSVIEKWLDTIGANKA